MMGLVTLGKKKKNTPKSKKAAISKPRRRPLQSTKSPNTLILDFQTSEL